MDNKVREEIKHYMCVIILHRKGIWQRRVDLRLLGMLKVSLLRFCGTIGLAKRTAMKLVS